MKPSKSSRLPLAASLTLVAGFAVASCVPEPVEPVTPRPPVNAILATAPPKIALGSRSLVDMTTRTEGSSPTAATWQYISGAEAFNNKLDARLISIFDARAGGHHEPAALPATPSVLLSNGVSITHEIVLAAGNVVGSRFVQTTMAGGVLTGLTDEITYEDLSTGVVSASASLINPAEIDSLRELLREVPVPGTPDPSTVAGPIPDAELLSAVALTPAGDLSITFRHVPGTGAALADPATVVLSPEATHEIISPSGQALRQAVMAKAAFAPPAPAPGGAEHVNCDLVACAALTYDDGPNAQTSRLLGILEKHRVFATFFQQGGYVKANPAVARSVAAAGHPIANHTMTHPYLTKLSPAGIGQEVQGTQAAIEKATGIVPAYLRPPYGASNKTVAASVGLPLITWDVDSLDWQSRNKSVFIPRIMGLVKPGSIILQHDVHATTVDGQDELITQLKGKGFYLVTLPQLFAGIDLKAGGSYKCRGTAPGCVPGR
ncbi:polysaccharide deacetylase family protein [Paenarthrobacter sp. NPDC056912]|uniref:polysaccharide deacetylase family protein n=1 Tax=Paenarthrobacter sp. NPDC056912 TaxID=3345965 RepID=UPI00366E2FE7